MTLNGFELSHNEANRLNECQMSKINIERVESIGSGTTLYKSVKPGSDYLQPCTIVKEGRGV